MGASLSIGQGVVMIGQVITTGRCHCLQPVIRQTAAVMPTRSRKRIIKLIVRVIHLIYPKNFFQASFIESAVVRNQRQVSPKHKGTPERHPYPPP